MDDHHPQHDPGVTELLTRALPARPGDPAALVRAGMTRGRRLRRRHQAGTAVAALAVVGVIGGVAAAVPQLQGAGPTTTIAADPTPAPSPPATTPSSTPSSTPSAPGDGAATLAVRAVDVPATVEAILGRHGAGPLRTEPAYSSGDGPGTLVAHFSWEGTLASVVIDPAPADPGARCGAGGPGTTCTTDAAGHPLLTWGPTTADGVTAQGVTVWQRGFEVSAVSYDAADGKDAAPLLPAPPLSLAELATVAGSDAWFTPGAAPAGG